MALGLAAGIPNAIALHLTSSHAAAVLVQDGMPQVVNQLVIPGGNVSLQERATAIVGAVEQMAGYYEDYQAVEAGGESESLPVVLTGDLSEHAPLVEAIRSVMPREVMDFQPPVVYPEEFSASEYGINLGLALASEAKQKEISSNLLPERYLPRALPVVAVAIFAVLLVLGAGIFYFRGPVAEKQEEEASLSDDVSRKQRRDMLVRGRAMKLHQDTEAVRGQAGRLESQVDDLRLEMEEMLVRLHKLSVTALPPSVRVPELIPDEEEFVVSGTAAKYEEILLYVENLRESGLFDDVKLNSVTGSGIGARPDTGQQEDEASLRFQLTISVASEEEEGEGEGGPFGF